MTILPDDPEERKKYPIYSGAYAYFPNAIALVSRCSYQGNLQHHPDKPLHWDRTKSTDELDALMRHIAEGEWDKVMAAVKQCHEKMHEMGAPRCGSTLRVGTRVDREQSMRDKLDSVYKKMEI